MLRVFFKSGFFKSDAHALRHLEYLSNQGPLFNGTREVNLETQKTDVEKFPEAPKRWFVYSLTREDQQRLQVDRGYFQDLMEAQRLTWAKAYNVPPNRLHICASFHDVTHHPHIHVVLHGETASDGFIVQRDDQEQGEAFKRCRETVKGAITREIFRGDTESIKADKGRHRQQLNAQLEKLLLEIGRTSHPISQETREALAALAGALEALPGKHQYGYLPPRLKAQVDALLQSLVVADQPLRSLFELYRKNQSELVKYQYVGKDATLAKKMKEWEESFFHPSKGGDTRRHNLIIQAAEAYVNGMAGSQLPKPTAEINGWKEGDSMGISGLTTSTKQVPTRAEAEHNKKKNELQQRILMELEREMGGPVCSTVMSALYDAAPKEGGWQQQSNATQMHILMAEKAILNEFPSLSETVTKLAVLERTDSGELLERAGWLHRRMLQYARCLDWGRGEIDFNAIRALRSENAALSDLMQTVRAEAIQLLDELPELRPQPGADLRSAVDTLTELCIEKTSFPAVLDKTGEAEEERAWTRKMARSVVRAVLLEYLPPEDRQELAQQPALPPSPEMRALMSKVRASLERRLKKGNALYTVLGTKFLKIREKLNSTKEYRYTNLPAAAKKMVDETVQLLVQQPAVRRLLKAAGYAEPDLSVLCEWVTEYACAATQDQPVDLSIPQKRQARYKFLCAFDRTLCQSLNDPSARIVFLELANKCLGKMPEQRNQEDAERPSYWELNKDSQSNLDERVARMLAENETLHKVAQDTAVMLGKENWPSEQLDKGWLQNIMLERLDEWRRVPHKPIQPRYAERYTPKTLDAAARNLLYLIAATVCDDAQRSQARLPRQAGRTKFKRKHIHKRTIEERSQDIGR